MKYIENDEELLEIHEVYYNKDGTLNSHTKDATDPHGENIDELRFILNKMLEALDKPILTEEDFKK